MDSGVEYKVNKTNKIPNCQKKSIHLFINDCGKH